MFILCETFNRLVMKENEKKSPIDHFKFPYEERLKKMMLESLRKNELHKFFMADSNSDYYVLRYQKEDTSQINNVLDIMVLLFDTDEEYEVHDLIINSIKEMLFVSDINRALLTIVGVVYSYYYIKQEYINLKSETVFIDNELRKKRISHKNVDFSEVKNQFLQRLLSNRDSLIKDKRWGGVEWNSKNGNWEIIIDSIEKISMKHKDDENYTFVKFSEIV